MSPRYRKINEDGNLSLHLHSEQCRIQMEAEEIIMQLCLPPPRKMVCIQLITETLSAGALLIIWAATSLEMIFCVSLLIVNS